MGVTGGVLGGVYGGVEVVYQTEEGAPGYSCVSLPTQPVCWPCLSLSCSEWILPDLLGDKRVHRLLLGIFGNRGHDQIQSQTWF